MTTPPEITCPRCKGKDGGAAHFLNDYPGAMGHCGMCDGAGTVPALSLESLTNAQLRKVGGWDPDLSAHSPEVERQILLTAARNRYGESVPVEMVA